MITFRYADDAGGVLVVYADIGEWTAGSVVIREHNSRQVAIGQLHVVPEWRGQRVARRLMTHAIGLFPRAEKWLYAELWVPEGSRPGPPREILERFYASLGFVAAEDSQGRRAMVLRLTRRDGCR